MTAGCGRTLDRGGGGVVSLTGKIGPVRLGLSTQRDIIVSLGKPEATADDSFRFAGAPWYHALGYGCTAKKRPDAAALRYGATTGPYCHTIYYVNTRKGVLGSFWTTSRAFTTSHGTTVGTPGDTAARREKRPLSLGCHIGIRERSRNIMLVLEVVAFRLVRTGPHRARPRGGHIFDIEADSPGVGVGLLFC
ncbi:MAG: hypothetical protein ACJ757_07135 [Gaiellaceae bacterium]